MARGVDLDGFRAIALALPEAVEQDHRGRPSFRVRDRIFATLWPDGMRVVLRLPREEHEALIAAEPETFAEIPGWERLHRTFVGLRTVDAGELKELVAESWRGVAPKRLVTAYEAEATGR